MASNEESRQRLFFALWPDTALQECFYQLGGGLHRISGGKRVRAEKLHITLAFLGSVDTATRNCLEQMADDIKLPAFNLTLDKTGYWKRPRVVWLGCDETPQPLTDLVRAINRGIAECGLEPERRAFHPHLTLLRKALRGGRPEHPETFEWPVCDFVLVASNTLPTGAEYEILSRWPLVQVKGER